MAFPVAITLPIVDDVTSDDVVFFGQPCVRDTAIAQAMPGLAIFSPCRRYRFRLTRLVAPPIDATPGQSTRCCFIMLNPSTADALVLDPTVRKCCAFAKAWGHDALDVVNLFALRATQPKPALYTEPNPAGACNADHILEVASRASRIVVAWGNHGALFDTGKKTLRALADRGLLERAVYFKQTKSGMPEHPLYQPYGIEMRPALELPR